MPKKINAYLTIEHLENHIDDERELLFYVRLLFYMRGYFNKLAFNYEKMNINQIKSDLEDLKVVFDFLDKMRQRGFKNE